MKNILITTSSFGKFSKAPLEKLEQAGFSPVLSPYGRKLTEGEAIELVSEHNPVGILAGVEPLTNKVMTSSDSLKAIARCGIGMDSVDQSAAAKLGLKVSNTPDAPTVPVAEITMGAFLCLLRGIHNSCEGIRSGHWERPMGGLLGYRTVGIVGLGRIGRQVIEMLRPFGCRVLGYDPYADSPEGVEAVTLEELYAQADIISLHVPYSEETHHMINAETIASMPEGAVVVNYARGGLIDEQALSDALNSGHLGGAALDCFEKEPYDGPLKEYSNVLLTGHIGSYAQEGRIIMETQAVENILTDLGWQGVA